MPDRTVIKEVKNAKLYSDRTILIRDVRWSYPHVFVPKAGKNDDGTPTKPTFQLVGLAPKATHREAKDLIKAFCDEMMAEHKVRMLPPERKFMRDGDQTGSDENVGMYVISTREQESRPPKVRGPDGSVWTAATHGNRIYGGCYGNILIRPWWQDNSYGKRINSGLVACQFLREGEPFGQGRITDEDVDETFDDETGGSGGYDTDDL